MPMVKKDENGAPEIRYCLFAVSVARTDIGNQFAALAREAGAACAGLPAEFQARIGPHCPIYVQNPTAWWIAMLWEFHGGGLFGAPPRPDYTGPRATFSRAFLISLEAIAQCGLHTEMPSFRLREGVVDSDPDGDWLQQSQLDLTIFGGVTPMPSLDDGDETKITLASHDRPAVGTDIGPPESSTGASTPPHAGQGDENNPPQSTVTAVSSLAETPEASRHKQKNKIYHSQGSVPEWSDPPDRNSGWYSRSLIGTEKDLAEYILGDSETNTSRHRQLRKLIQENDTDYFGSNEGRYRVRIFIRDKKKFSEANSRKIGANETKEEDD